MTLHEKNDKHLKEIQQELKALRDNIHLYNELARILNEASAMHNGKGPANAGEWNSMNAKFRKVLQDASPEAREAFSKYAKSQGFNEQRGRSVHDPNAVYLWDAVKLEGLKSRLDGMQNQSQKLGDEASEVSTRAQDVITKNNDIISIASGLSGGQKDQTGQFWSRM